jgi:hypothetical protein
LIDIKSELENAVKRLEQNDHLETLVLCLKIVSKIRVQFSDLAELHYTLLNKIGTLIKDFNNREKLGDKDREVFYKEVKCFIKSIEFQESKIKEPDDEKWNMIYRQSDGTYMDKFNSCLMKKKDFPNLSNLFFFINVKIMLEYPRFALLCYEALIDHMPIFEN